MRLFCIFLPANALEKSTDPFHAFFPAFDKIRLGSNFRGTTGIRKRITLNSKAEECYLENQWHIGESLFCHLSSKMLKKFYTRHPYHEQITCARILILHIFKILWRWVLHTPTETRGFIMGMCMSAQRHN